MMSRRMARLVAVAIASAILGVATAGAQEVKHYRFAYDQPKTTGYGILGDIFSDKLKALSKGTMLIDQYPGAQLGQEPQVLQLVKSGDVEFCISSSANAAPLAPQAGGGDVAENGVNVYLANKHYEVAPVLSMTEHEANNSLVWVSDKVWNSLTPEQQGWVQGAADEVNKTQPAKAFELEHQSQDKLKSIGVKVVTDVDKSGFVAIADPYLDKLAKELGPHAEKVKNLIRAIN